MREARPFGGLLHILPAVDAILSIGIFSSLSYVSFEHCGSVVVVELAIGSLLYLTLYLYFLSVFNN